MSAAMTCKRNWRCTSSTACCICAATMTTPRSTAAPCANANAIICSNWACPTSRRARENRRPSPMPPVKATALVLRTTDWSETSRIATLWTREFGKVRALAKGGRRLKSSFESALDLLNVCGIVLLRKSSGSLDLLTEARVVQRFPRLRTNLEALYAGYYVAELLADWTEDHDAHPGLFDEALATLDALGGTETGPGAGQRV